MNNKTDRCTEINTAIDYGKSVSSITKIKDLPSKFDYEIDNIIIGAYIFGMDIIVSEKNFTYITLKLSDMTDSIIGRLVVPSKSLKEVLEKVKIGTSWVFYGECFNKKYDGMGILKMQQIPSINESLIDREQEKYFFFEALDLDTVKQRKREELKDKALNTDVA